jgi:hypothetical protein
MKYVNSLVIILLFAAAAAVVVVGIANQSYTMQTARTLIDFSSSRVII